MPYEHVAFKIDCDEFIIVFIPTLKRVFRVKKELADAVPDHIFTDTPPPASQLNNLPDYMFCGTNLICTNHCNLACVYCYGECSPKKEVTMIREVAIAAVDYALNCTARIGRKLAYANFFGGEPTQVWDLVTVVSKHMRESAAKLGLRNRLTITTNGCMDRKQARWLAENLDSINISIDGPKDIQDLQRSMSFDKVFATTQEIYKIAPQKLRFRATVSAFSVQSLSRIVDFLGINFPGCPQMYEPLFTMGRAKKLIQAMPDMDVFFNAFLIALPIATKHNCKLKTSVLNLTGKSREFFCGVASRNFMITPYGEVVACNRMTDRDINTAADAFIYGRYDNSKACFVFDNAKYQHLKTFTVSSISSCDACFARSSCRGDCIANKAAIHPKNFQIEQSYRCQAVQQFVKNVLIYITNHGNNYLLA